MAKRSIDIAVFELGEQRFGLPAAQVHQIAPSVRATPVPNAPPVVEGVINVHGELVPMLDIRQRLGLKAKRVALSDHLILGWTRERLVALRVDRVAEIVAINAAAIELLEPVVPGAVYVSGVAKLPEGLVLIQDLTLFLSAAESDDLSAALDASVRRGDA